MSIKKYTYILAAFMAAINLIGCASVRPRIEKPSSLCHKGMYYEIKRGDTLWKISKLYDVGVNDIVKANKLPDATRISTGQKLFIPQQSGSEDLKYTRISPCINGEAKFIWPVQGKVTSYFGDKKGLITNKGIDIEASEGTNVIAADDGLVSFVDENMKGLGKTLIVDHGNGFSTVYARNSEILVKVGDEVKKSAVIAKVGRTGRASEPYLHFQVRKGHEPQNPFNYLPH